MTLMLARRSSLTPVGLGGESIQQVVDAPFPSLRCGAHGCVHGLPAVGRPRGDAGVAACGGDQDGQAWTSSSGAHGR
jgi:hypothetical protein